MNDEIAQSGIKCLLFKKQMLWHFELNEKNASLEWGVFDMKSKLSLKKSLKQMMIRYCCKYMYI